MDKETLYLSIKERLLVVGDERLTKHYLNDRKTGNELGILSSF